MPRPQEELEETVRNRVLFSLMERAHGKHWKSGFELEFVLASKRDDQPIPKEVVMPFARDLARAIEFFHGAFAVIDLETMQARPARGEASAYVFFDGYTLRVGSVGYQG
jgi:hypothetical protein